MTNKQFLINQIENMNNEKLAEIIVQLDDYKRCEFCNFDKGLDNCRISDCLIGITEWLKAEHKEPIKLSEAERVILENLDKEYTYIARDENGHLFIFEIPPVKVDRRWYCDVTNVYVSSFTMFDYLFKFIKWEDTEPYNIEELLKCK